MEHLPSMYKQLVQSNFIKPEEIYLNILERPNYYNIQIFSSDKKAAIIKRYEVFIDWLAKEKISPEIGAKFQVCLDYMSNKDQSHLWPKFLSETAVLDELRGEKL